MNTYRVSWSKTYYASGVENIEAVSTTNAEEIALDTIIPTMQSDDGADWVESLEIKNEIIEIVEGE